MTTTATFATLFRGLAGSKRQANARPDNEEMLPLELWGYEPSPFVCHTGLEPRARRAARAGLPLGLVLIRVSACRSGVRASPWTGDFHQRCVR